MRAVIHEMRNHLAIAVANLEAFLDGKLQPTPARLTAVLQALNEIDVLIDDLPRDGAAMIESHVETIDVCQLITNEVTAMEGYASERDVRIDLEMCETIGPDCPHFLGDPTRIAQIVTNVLTNAVRYSPKGGVVSVVCRRSFDSLEFSVRDEGPGIAADEIPRIFERDFRGSASAAFPGSGIGLSLVKQFVEFHGGSIAVDSVPGAGATFTIRLPGMWEAQEAGCGRGCLASDAPNRV
jgi:signal transduction histidine kinase